MLALLAQTHFLWLVLFSLKRFGCCDMAHAPSGRGESSRSGRMDGQRLAAAPNGGTYMSETTDGPQQQPHLRRSAARRRTNGRPNPSRSSERSESSERRPGSEVSQEDGELPIGGVDPFGEPPTLLELVCRVRDARYNDAMLDRSLTFEERAPMANSRARDWHEHGMRLTRGSRTDRCRHTGIFPRGEHACEIYP